MEEIDPMPIVISEVMNDTHLFRDKCQMIFDEIDKTTIGLEKMKLVTKLFNFIYTNYHIIDRDTNNFTKSVIVILEEQYKNLFRENTYEKTFGIHYQLLFLACYRLYKKFYESPKYTHLINFWEEYQEEYEDVIFEMLLNK